MEMNEYQGLAKRTAFFPNLKQLDGLNYLYPVLGLVGEAGEVAEKIKKIIRDKNGYMSPEDKQAVIKELGDVLWYIATIASELDETLQFVAVTNLEKLNDRYNKGTLSGSGDNR